MISILMRVKQREVGDTQRRKPYELHRHKAQNTWSHQKLEEVRKESMKEFPLEPGEGTQPC